MKPRIAAYVPADVARRLELAAERPGATKSDIVAEALDRFLDPARDKQLAAMVLNGQRELSGDLGSIAREQAVVAETLGLFVRYMLTITPPLPRDEQESARLIGRKRYETFVAEVGRRIASDRTLVSEVLPASSGTNPRRGVRPIDSGPAHQAATDNAAPAKASGTMAQPLPTEAEEVSHG
jgi:predicted DNA-binding protein